MNGVHKLLSKSFKETIKQYNDIYKMLDPLVKAYFEKYYEEWQHFNNWHFSEDGENIIIDYSYLDYNDEWDYDQIDISIERIIETIYILVYETLDSKK